MIAFCSKLRRKEPLKFQFFFSKIKQTCCATVALFPCAVILDHPQILKEIERKGNKENVALITLARYQLKT
jgi:hypothetical protein